MKALVKEKAAPGFNLKEVDIPTPGKHEVLVRVKMAAICGTDIHIYEWDDWAANMRMNIPGIFGHECVAEIVELGEDVQSLKVGDRISIETHIPCGNCRLCKNGSQHICENITLFSFDVDGCFAEYTVVPELCARKIPDSIPDKVAAVMEPVGVGVHAAQVSNVKGKKVVVLGAGPIGLFSACAALALGAEAVKISDVKESRLKIAAFNKDLMLWNPLEREVSRLLNNEFVPDVIIETTGNEGAIVEAMPFVRKGGNVTFVGLFPNDIPLNISRDIIWKEVTLRGIHGRRIWDTWDLAEDLILTKKLDVEFAMTHQLPLEDFEEGFRLARSGEAMKVLLCP